MHIGGRPLNFPHTSFQTLQYLLLHTWPACADSAMVSPHTFLQQWLQRAPCVHFAFCASCPWGQGHRITSWYLPRHANPAGRTWRTEGVRCSANNVVCTASCTLHCTASYTHHCPASSTLPCDPSTTSLRSRRVWKGPEGRPMRGRERMWGRGTAEGGWM